MPLIKSAIKKMRKDRVRYARNRKRGDALKTLIKAARVEKSPQNLTAAFSALDKAAKVNLIHPNKTARLKSRLSKGISQVTTKAKKKSPKKKIVKKLK